MPASDTEARMTPVLSATISTCIAGGRRRQQLRQLRLIWSTVAITFAPGWRCTLSTMAGVRSNQAPCSMFWAACGDAGDVAQQHRRAVLIGDHRVQVILRDPAI